MRPVRLTACLSRPNTCKTVIILRSRPAAIKYHHVFARSHSVLLLGGPHIVTFDGPIVLHFYHGQGNRKQETEGSREKSLYSISISIFKPSGSLFQRHMLMWLLIWILTLEIRKKRRDLDPLYRVMMNHQHPKIIKKKIPPCSLQF